MIAVLLVITMAWLVGGFTLFLHYLSRHYGALPLSFFVAAIVAMLDIFEFAPFFIVPTDGVVFIITSDVLVPSTLLAILVLYVVNGTRPAQLAIFGIIAVGLLVYVVVLTLWVTTHLLEPHQLEGSLTEPGAISWAILGRMAVGRMAFLADMLVIVIVFQALHNYLPRLPIGLTSGVALMAALWTDTLVYTTLTEFGTPDWVQLLPGALLVRTFFGIMLAPLLAIHFEVILPSQGYHLAAEQKDRPVFDVLSNTAHRVLDMLRDAETEVLARTQIYEQLIDNLDDYILWLAGPSGDSPIYYISPGFERLTGYKRDLVYRNPATMLRMIHPQDRPRYNQPLLFYLQDKPEDDFRIMRPDGTTRWVRSKVFLIHDEAGQLVRIGGMVEDITQQKSDQDRQFALALEQEKVRLLENFIRDASHDLRTPISALAMSLHILKTSPDASMRQRHLDSLENRVNYLNRLIDNLFTLTKVETGNSGEFQPLSLEPLLREIVNHLSALATEKGLQVILDLSDNLPLMRGDRLQIERAFNNLIENAIRYTMTGSITIRTRHEAAQQLYIEISDTGIGIAPEDMPRLFDRFYRAPSAAKHWIQGTGLGLAIVKSVIERHHGTITVQSTPGGGTTFEIRLPQYAPVLQPSDVFNASSA